MAKLDGYDNQAILFNFVSVCIVSLCGVYTFPVQGVYLPSSLLNLGS